MFLADDHPIFRHGIRELLCAHEDFEVIGEASDGWSALRAPALDRADVVVLDLALPKLDGTEVLRRLVKERPQLPVVVLSMYPEEQVAARAIADGAAAYVGKQRPPSELVACLRRVVGRAQLDGELVAVPPSAPAHHALTPREFQVFTLVVRGRTPTEVAAELGLTIATVSTHLGHVRSKLGVHSIAELTQYAIRHELVSH
ncbi:MAG: response regulator transcription factor [Myxococcales bacterium]|nr:response regulator transcription factor [Myxococcales bacterium]